MENKFNALSLKSVDYAESDKIVTLLTLERGRIAVKARGVRTAKAKLRYAVSPLCFGTYIIADRNGKGIITACDVIDSFDCVAADLVKYYVAAIILECADKFSEDDTPDKELFFLIIGALKELCYGNAEPWRVGLTFLAGLLKKLGYGMSVDTNSSEPYCFDFDNGRVTLYRADIKYHERLTAIEAKLIGDISDDLVPQGEFEFSAIKNSYLLLSKYVGYITGKKLNTPVEFIRILQV